MRILELLKFSFMNLWRRKLRTSLTVLGVVIGTASIVVMMSIGIGLNYSYLKTIENSSTLTLIRVSGGGWGEAVMYDVRGGGSYSSDSDSGERSSLDRTAIDQFAGLDHVTVASPVYTFDVFARSGSYESYLNIYAMDYDMLMALKLPVMKGELPSPGDPFTLIAGRRVAFNFYNPSGGEYIDFWNNPDAEPPVDMLNTSLFAIYDMNAYWEWQSTGEGDPPKKYMLETSAIIGEENSDYGYSQFDYNVYADLSAVEETFQKVFKKNAWPNQQTDKNGKPITPMVYNEAYVIVDNIDNVAAVQKQITDMGFQAYSEIDYLKAMQDQSRIIQYVLGGIGSIALLVAAIGITNTMLMSIFERTKEIGIFKVLGCSLPNIRTMFLSEAALIGFGGGMLGLGLSFLLSFLLNIFMESVSVIPFWLALAGLGIAVVVALVAGITPALRAMKLSPLEAIRSL